MLSKTNKLGRAKLPRKRKKLMIKAQGRKSYRDTIALAMATGETPCKFWVNKSVTMVPTSVVTEKGVQIAVLPMPKQYW